MYPKYSGGRSRTFTLPGQPDYQIKKARVEHLYAIADGEVVPDEDKPQVIWCLDEFGPLNLMPRSGRQWAERGGKYKAPEREPPSRMPSVRRLPRNNHAADPGLLRIVTRANAA